MGLYLSREILNHGDRIIFIGRARNGLSFRERMSNALGSYEARSAEFVEADIVDGEVKSMIESVSRIPWPVDGVWHLAADLSFNPKNRERVFSVNIGGTRNAIKLSENLKCPLYYISTAYVHGRRSGVAFERYEARPKKFNNAYEESKFETEQLIKNASNLKTVIFRPSILIDHDTKRTSNFGYYSFIVSMLQFRDALKLNDYQIAYIPFPFFYYSKSLLNLMPVTTAVTMMYRISQDARSQGKIFHICNPNPFPVGDIFKQTLDALCVRIPLFGVPKAIALVYFVMFSFFGSFMKSFRSIAKRIKYFKWYIIERISYDMTNTKELSGDNFGDSFKFPSDYIYITASSFCSRIRSQSHENIKY